MTRAPVYGASCFDGVQMLELFWSLPLADRLFGIGVGIVFSFVMYRSLRSFSRSSSAGWYRGFQSTAAFQIIMWLAALPFLVPAVCLYLVRRARLKEARFVGNIGSRVFHSRKCEYQVKMRSDLLRFPLASRDEAVRRGFRPCNWCLPGR